MMLRSRNHASVQNIQQQPAAKDGKGTNATMGDGPIKRNAKQQPKGEPKAKRAVLNEINKGITSFVIDSSKKVDQKKSIKQRTTGRRSNSASEESPDAENGSGEVEVLKVVQNNVDPCPRFDFDKQCLDNKDDFAVPMFAFDIFRYYRSREAKFAVGDYMSRHPNLNKDIRAVLIDWMVEVQESFELNHETLYLAVKLYDTYMSRKENVAREELQLIASACIFIASKFDERSPPLIDDFMYLCNDEFTREQLIKMEMDVLGTVGMDLGCPLSYRYLRRYARATSTQMPTLTLSRYILELSLCYYEFVGVRESLVASAAFYLALKMHNKNAEWTPILHKYSGYAFTDIEHIVKELNQMLHRQVEGLGYKVSTVVQKYSHEVFNKVATVSLLPGSFDLGRPLMKDQPFCQQEQK